MLLRRLLIGGLLLVLPVGIAYAQIFGTVRGTVVDPQGASIPDAKVTLKAHASAFTKQAETDAAGAFTVSAVPADSYTIEIQHDGFETASQVVNVTILSAPVLTFPMKLSGIETSVAVTAEAEAVNTDASSPPVTVEKLDIQRTPGADRAASRHSSFAPLSPKPLSDRLLRLLAKRRGQLRATFPGARAPALLLAANQSSRPTQLRPT